MDGATASWRECRILASGSVLLRVEGKFSVWYDSIIKPWIHYVPIKKDLSDLVEKIQWLRNNDKAAKKITENARKFVLTYFSFQNQLMFIKDTLIEYSKLPGSKPEHLDPSMVKLPEKYQDFQKKYILDMLQIKFTLPNLIIDLIKIPLAGLSFKFQY